MDTETIFWKGPIPATVVTQWLQAFATDERIGAYSVFLGQVRNDRVNNQLVTGIEYTSYEAMAEAAMQQIATEVTPQYGLLQVKVLHSLGHVASGEICLLVLTAAGHRKAAMQACDVVVDRIKNELPVWGKELLEGEGHQWKVNS